jgi:hypothetical protein
MTGKLAELSLKETMNRYPHITMHIMAESLGYAAPSCAANILKDAREGRKNHCEWIYSGYSGDAGAAVRDAIKHRHTHQGFIAEYKLSLALVRRALGSGDEPDLGSWF